MSGLRLGEGIKQEPIAIPFHLQVKSTLGYEERRIKNQEMAVKIILLFALLAVSYSAVVAENNQGDSIGLLLI